MSKNDEESIGISQNSNWLGRMNPFSRKYKPAIPKERLPCPEHTANFFSLLTFSWMSSILYVGSRRPLELNDIWTINPSRSTFTLSEKLKTTFYKNHERGLKRPLIRAMFQTFKTDMIIGGIASLLASIIQVIIPFVIKYIIAFAGKAWYSQYGHIPEPPIREGIGLLLGITILQILGSIGNQHFFYRGTVVGGEVRSCLISIIFDKAMTISSRAKAGTVEVEPPPANIKPGSEEEKEHYAKQLPGDKKATKAKSEGWSNGRIVNLMSVDTFRVDKASGWFHLAWSSPLAMIVTIVLLIVNLTYSALVGVFVFLVVAPVLGKAVKLMFSRRKTINILTDSRISVTQEALQAIRFIKYYGWEGEFMKRIASIRKGEIRSIRIMLTIRNVFNSIGNAIPIFASMLTFVTYSLTHHALDPAPVFSSLALFNGLRMPLIILPMIFALLSDALQSIDRIEEFLLSEDTKDTIQTLTIEESEYALDLSNASFTWEKTAPPDAVTGGGKLSREKIIKMKEEAKQAKIDAKKKKKANKKGAEVDVTQTTLDNDSAPQALPFAITDINLQINHGELIGVVGGVGSGKSSLLAAIAGEMRQVAGSAIASGTRALCPQVAWIQNATALDNVIFGKEFNQARYDQVIEACSLVHDMQVLPHGNLTEIGERGINLSGGQKHRVSLARAIYFDADIVLLDDPLAAVDAHVGVYIMDNAICGLLKDKCRILATHQLQVLHRCDRIVIMENGKIVACDTFEKLMADNDTFKLMMATIDSDAGQRNSGGDEKIEEELKPEKGPEQSPKALMQEEDRQVDNISWAVYADYWRSTGSILILPFVLFTLAIGQGANIVTNLWLAWWSANQFGYPTGTYVGVYAALGVAQALLLFIFSLTLSIFGTEASKRMLRRAMHRVLRAPVSFFDTTPLGRIMNRLSKDIDIMDNNLTESMRVAGTTTASLISTFILIIAYYYYFAVALVPLLTLFVFLSAYYRASAREIKRHESVLRSSVFSQFSEAISGVPTLRAYGVQSAFSNKLLNSIDDMDSAYYLTFANQRWLCCRLDAISVIFFLVTGILIITNRFSINPAISGLVLSYLVAINNLLVFTVRQVAEMENNMNATERIHYYGHNIPEEAPEETKNFDLPPSWPQRGEIKLRDVEMRYRDGLPLILKGLNLDIHAGERIGIVGRTGAGKSSIMVALFRLVELASGSITIDDIDISTVGLQDLRSRISIIPQDPTLFKGTVRSNIDPLEEHSDLDLWNALRQSHLVDPNQNLNTNSDNTNAITLETPIAAEGANISLGQRQLLALARVLVRDSRIIIMDEATSSIDYESDRKVQETIVTGFKGKTLLCIAHRLKTIIGYDRVCVLDEGRVVELDTPLVLFSREGGVFRGMCERSGIGREEILGTGREKEEVAN